MKKIKQKLTVFIFGIFLFAGTILPVTVFAQDYEDSPFAMMQGEWGVDGLYDFSNIHYIGSHWTRTFIPNEYKLIGDTTTLEASDFDFTKLDESVQEIWINNNIYTFLKLPMYLPGNILMDHAKYKDFCEIMIERYDGDSIDDMPGSPIIKYWAVTGTEMETHLWPSKHTAAETAAYISIGYATIKKEHPEFHVLFGGSAMTTSWEGPGDYYYDMVANLVGNQRCPEMIFNFHTWKHAKYWKKNVDNLNTVKTCMNTFGYNDNDIWVGEGGSYDDYPPFDPVTDCQMAGDVIRTYVSCIANGLDKFFWEKIVEYDWTDDDSSIFDFTGLINNPRNNDGKSYPKLGYYTYKLMVKKLEGSDWDNIQIIQESDNIYIYKFLKQGEPTYVAWWDYFDDPTYTIGDSSLITLTGIFSNQVIVTDAVPNYPSGDYITDYNTAFQIDTLTVSGGSVSFYLKESPVFVEEYNATSVNEINLSSENIKIYPNPTTGIFIIQGDNIQSIEITNISGQIIKQLSIINCQLSIDLSGQPKGIYFVKIQNDDFISVKKIVIQ